MSYAQYGPQRKPQQLHSFWLDYDPSKAFICAFLDSTAILFCIFICNFVASDKSFYLL